MAMAEQMWINNRNLQGKLNTPLGAEYLSMIHQHMGVVLQSLKDNSYLLDMVQVPLRMIPQGNSNVLDTIPLVQKDLLSHNNNPQYRVDSLKKCEGQWYWKMYRLDRVMVY